MEMSVPLFFYIQTVSGVVRRGCAVLGACNVDAKNFYCGTCLSDFCNDAALSCPIALLVIFLVTVVII